MPNWCGGSVCVSGKDKDILEFCKYFVFENEKEKPKYFARSFIHSNWKDFIEDEIEDGCFFVDFAWSVTSCLISGYPQDNPDKCITLMDACKKHNVKVDITSEESGVGFEEHIICNSNGKLTKNECSDMPTYKCKCGSEQFVSSYEDVKDIVCYECDKSNLGEIVK